jgi:hypothetical protein
MAERKPRYSMDEFVERGEAFFEKDIGPHVKKRAERDFVAIDIEAGAYEIDADEMAAAHRLEARVPDAQIWVRRVGSPYARSFGGHKRLKDPMPCNF